MPTTSPPDFQTFLRPCLVQVFRSCDALLIKRKPTIFWSQLKPKLSISTFFLMLCSLKKMRQIPITCLIQSKFDGTNYSERKGFSQCFVTFFQFLEHVVLKRSQFFSTWPLRSTASSLHNILSTQCSCFEELGKKVTHPWKKVSLGKSRQLWQQNSRTK